MELFSDEYIESYRPLFDNIKVIRGSVDYPYMIIKGTDHSTNNRALYSTDARYDIIKGTQSENLVRGSLALIVLWGVGELLIKINLNILGAFLRNQCLFLYFLSEYQLLKKTFLFL